jgi:N-acetylglucosamine kinase-like BadF-type ATPase
LPVTVVLGVEGGGSHSHAIAATTLGEVLGFGFSRDPSNWEDVGIEAAGAAIKSCVRSALKDAGVQPDEVVASVFALAGVDFPMDEERLGGIPEALRLGGEMRIMNDAFASLRAGTNRAFGVVVVVGTGSTVVGMNPEGRPFRTLGLGPLFGDWGSASEVSEAGVTAVAHAYIGRGPETALSELLPEAAGASSVVDFLEGAARGRIDGARFASLVLRAAGSDDAVAQGVLTRAGETLGATAAHVIRTLGMEGIEFDLVLAGGMVRSGSRYLLESLEAAVHAVAPLAVPVRLETAPVVGAALLAIDLSEGTSAPEARGALAAAVESRLGPAG